MLTQACSYDAIVERHGLSTLFKGGDISIDETGNLALSKAGDIRNGSIVHDAMFRLVTFWRLNAPSMRLMFESLRELRDKEASLEAAIDDRFGPSLYTSEDGLSRYYAATDALATASFGRTALAGSLMIVAASLFGQFKHNIEASNAEWEEPPGSADKYSLGQAITAAANGFRHYDEWVKARFARRISGQQRRSMQILVAVLGLNSENDLFGEVSACERLAFQIGQDSFDHFEGEALRFANTVAIRVEGRSELEK